MKQLLKIIFILLTFSTSIFAGHGITQEERYEQAVFVLRQNGACAKDDEDTEDYHYLFRRTFHEKPGTEHDPRISRKVGKLMKAGRSLKTVLDRSMYFEFDWGGTCSAMAFDFLARYLDECADSTDAHFCLAKVKEFAPYYKTNNTTFVSKQAAYNAVKLKPGCYADEYDDEFKWDKMQTLARYHNFALIPATRSISRYEIKWNPEEFKQTVDELPEGAYLVRALSPCEWNEKKESYGHSMILIKGKQHGIYYDNAYGAVDITNRVSEYVQKKLENWWIPECRFYFASPNGKILNLSQETWD